jgi:Tfp pilus assembly protein PilF
MKSADGKTEGIADCWYNLGIIFKQTGKKMKAIEMLEKALEIRREMIGDVSLQVPLKLNSGCYVFGDFGEDLHV